MKIRTILKATTFIGTGMIAGDIIWNNAPKEMTVFGMLFRWIGGSMVATAACTATSYLIDKVADEVEKNAESFGDQVENAVTKAVNGVTSAVVAKVKTEVKTEIRKAASKLDDDDKQPIKRYVPVDKQPIKSYVNYAKPQETGQYKFVIDDLTQEDAEDLEDTIKSVLRYSDIYTSCDLLSDLYDLNLSADIDKVKQQLETFRIRITRSGDRPIVEESKIYPNKWRIKIPAVKRAQ